MAKIRLNFDRPLKDGEIETIQRDCALWTSLRNRLREPLKRLGWFSGKEDTDFYGEKTTIDAIEAKLSAEMVQMLVDRALEEEDRLFKKYQAHLATPDESAVGWVIVG